MFNKTKHPGLLMMKMQIKIVIIYLQFTHNFFKLKMFFFILVECGTGLSSHNVVRHVNDNNN